MRILWLSNAGITASDIGGGGTWIVSMAAKLAERSGIDLEIITFGDDPGFTRQDYGRVTQWLVPERARIKGNGLPNQNVVREIIEISRRFQPDLIHIWGTEAYWGLLTARRLLDYPALLGMQGLKGAIAQVFYGDMSTFDQLRCNGIKELLKHRFLFQEKQAFAKWGSFEKEMLQGHSFISVQSPWMKAQVLAVNPAAQLFDTERVLRPAFENPGPWQPAALPPSVFCSAAYSAPFKGLHFAIRAFARLRRRLPNVRLRIAGAHLPRGIRTPGYIRWVNALVRDLGLTEAVNWLGPLSGEQIVSELRGASAVLIPTFIESYCVALVEAMAVGVPAVAAYTGGTSYLGRDEETCLLYPPGDEAMCVYQLERVLTDRELSDRLSKCARQLAARRNDAASIIEKQMETYCYMLEASKSAAL